MLCVDGLCDESASAHEAYENQESIAYKLVCSDAECLADPNLGQRASKCRLNEERL